MEARGWGSTALGVVIPAASSRHVWDRRQREGDCASGAMHYWTQCEMTDMQQSSACTRLPL